MNRHTQRNPAKKAEFAGQDTVALPTARAADVKHPDRPESIPSADGLTHARRGLRDRLLDVLDPQDRAQILEATPYTAASDPVWVVGYVSMSAIHASADIATDRIEQAHDSIRTTHERLREAIDDLDDYRARVEAESESVYWQLTQHLQRDVKRQVTHDRKAARNVMRNVVLEVLSRRWPIFTAGVLAGMGLMAILGAFAIGTLV